jgi:hypothetical protein
MTDNIVFIAIAEFIGSVIACAMFEKGVSMYQHRPFNRKYMWAVWLIVFAVASFIGSIVHVIKSVWGIS